MPRTLECFQSKKYRGIQLFSREHQQPLTWALLNLQPLLLRETMSKSSPYGCNYRIFKLYINLSQSYYTQESITKFIEITIAKVLHLELYQ